MEENVDTKHKIGNGVLVWQAWFLTLKAMSGSIYQVQSQYLMYLTHLSVIGKEWHNISHLEE